MSFISYVLHINCVTLFCSQNYPKFERRITLLQILTICFKDDLAYYSRTICRMTLKTVD